MEVGVPRPCVLETSHHGWHWNSLIPQPNHKLLNLPSLLLRFLRGLFGQLLMHLQFPLRPRLIASPLISQSEPIMRLIQLRTNFNRLLVKSDRARIIPMLRI